MVFYLLTYNYLWANSSVAKALPGPWWQNDEAVMRQYQQRSEPDHVLAADQRTARAGEADVAQSRRVWSNILIVYGMLDQNIGDVQCATLSHVSFYWRSAVTMALSCIVSGNWKSNNGVHFKYGLGSFSAICIGLSLKWAYLFVVDGSSFIYFYAPTTGKKAIYINERTWKVSKWNFTKIKQKLSYR